MVPVKRPLQNVYLCLQKTLGSFKHHQNQKKVFLCSTATLKNPIGTNTDYSNIICTILWQKSALRRAWWSNPRFKQLQEVDVWRQIILSFPQQSSSEENKGSSALIISELFFFLFWGWVGLFFFLHFNYRLWSLLLVAVIKTENWFSDAIYATGQHY